MGRKPWGKTKQRTTLGKDTEQRCKETAVPITQICPDPHLPAFFMLLLASVPKVFSFFLIEVKMPPSTATTIQLSRSGSSYQLPTQELTVDSHHIISCVLLWMVRIIILIITMHLFQENGVQPPQFNSIFIFILHVMFFTSWSIYSNITERTLIRRKSVKSYGMIQLSNAKLQQHCIWPWC